MAGLNRRDFLKMIGLTGTTAAAGCSSESARTLIPYIIPPEDIIPGQASWYASTCRECPAGCGLLVKNRDGRVIKVEGNPLHPVNQGKLCIKGWNLHEYVNSFIRLKSPLIKKDGRFVKCTWEEAISHTAERLTAIVNQHGPDSVGVLLSAKMTNEENYLAQKFARAVIGTNNVDHCARL